MVCVSDEPMPVFSTMTADWGAFKKNSYRDLNARDSNLICPSHGLRSKSLKALR